MSGLCLVCVCVLTGTEGAAGYLNPRTRTLGELHWLFAVYTHTHTLACVTFHYNAARQRQKQKHTHTHLREFHAEAVPLPEADHAVGSCGGQIARRTEREWRELQTPENTNQNTILKYLHCV